MVEPVMEELEFLVEILNRHPTDSLKKISESEGIDYYRLKRLYDKYYGKYLNVSALYNLRLIGLKSFVAFLSVPPDELMEVANRMATNPFIGYINPAFGFKNGLSLIIYVPADQTDKIDDFISRYSQDYEYYEVRAYPYNGDDNFGRWTLSYDYAVLMDILKVDARTPITEIARRLGKTRPTVRFMINRLKEEGILVDFAPMIDMNIHDRGVIGLTKSLNEEVLERFREYEITVGVLPSYGYLLEWFFSSKEDLGSKILEFSNYVDKLLIEYFDTFKELNDMKYNRRFSDMVKKDGSGYRSILEF
ncbi:Lrp/AsnC family transcriptional regulator [Thermococcus sp. GR7]|uniref:Lrp/AsnC family transcriptional regulator n=1 Tax=unclassified Thermococcus TaxID=2627626 RepID=UPI00142F641A|nr:MULTISPECIES: Lrp/AsnC family transcriptional regulator [unclassified Thermococcus]NJE46166.1 Lrp/AsnC family transcriptional regulator [Thermococcus sp. GR7]NJE78198.1 Lrp/AsnC family transcriptional regulator [Thermococcus sp. GR4]NJF22363.1 Lrp/AsnC family transcriptional regulator [Thermococcus sp. GR5]